MCINMIFLSNVSQCSGISIIIACLVAMIVDSRCAVDAVTLFSFHISIYHTLKEMGQYRI